MIFGWQSLLSLLPEWMRQDTDRLARKDGQEIRLRLGGYPQLRTGRGSVFLNGKITREDLTACVNQASRYSPWTTAFEAQGFIPLPGGHRMGLCGEAAMRDGLLASFREYDGVCIRIARDIPEIGEGYIPEDSLLIVGAPGWGKTTLLRNISRRVSAGHTVCVLDERWELFPKGFPRGKMMDVLSGCSKKAGMELLVRSMGPEYIALDEITGEEDCRAIISASGCGVRLLATVHAAGMEDLLRRPIYRKLLQAGTFREILLLRPDQSFTAERVDTLCPCNTLEQS